MTVLEILSILMDEQGDHAAAIRDAWTQDLDVFWVGLDLATNPGINFSVDKAPLIPQDDDEPGTLTFEEFQEVANALATNRVPLYQISDVLTDLASRASRDEWNLWYRRILLRSLARHLPMATIQKELIRLTTE